MKIITVINGTERVIMQPENKLEEEILKRLDGASCQVIGSQNVNVLESNVFGGLLIQLPKNQNTTGAADVMAPDKDKKEA